MNDCAFVHPPLLQVAVPPTAHFVPVRFVTVGARVLTGAGEIARGPFPTEGVSATTLMPVTRHVIVVPASSAVTTYSTRTRTDDAAVAQPIVRERGRRRAGPHTVRTRQRVADPRRARTR